MKAQKPQLRGTMPKAAGSAPYVTYMPAKDMGKFIQRKKNLPVDANKEASTCDLYQLKETVDFRCAKCKKDHIRSDTVAADLSNSTMLCTRCFGKLIRPREYVPSRVVPFPSLLSWLSYEPQRVQTKVSADVSQRPVEAALPSGHRAAVGMLAGPQAKGVADLPETPMNVVEGGSSYASGTGLQVEVSTGTAGMVASRSILAGSSGISGGASHPCNRTFGSCGHGALCFFMAAPENLCLPHLMGICHNDRSCGLVHQKVFDLPLSGPAGRMPQRWGSSSKLLAPGGVAKETNEFVRWMAERKQSVSNKALWQLWNHPQVDALLNSLHPAPKAPAAPARVIDDIDEDDAMPKASTATASVAPTPSVLNAASVAGALAFLKKK